MKITHKLATARWRLEQKAHRLHRKLAHAFSIWRADDELHTLYGQRFLELKSLLEEFHIRKITAHPDTAREVASQLINVLRNCDSITYEEPGTAEAYAILHFLDRYHRFQLIFQELDSRKLIPRRTKGIKILDVGTGPGPSMFATSDFFTNKLNNHLTSYAKWDEQTFQIDYVEKSYDFRDWLHHFTEYANYYCPSKNGWRVPFHHGTFHDFSNIEFNSHRYETDYDSDGEPFTAQFTVRRRYDLIVFSNFLTTKNQVQQFASELQSCMRFLKHNGLMIIVGAPNRSRKYRDVYTELTKTLTEGRYGTKKIIAKCFPAHLPEPLMSYSWSDAYGTKVKESITKIYTELKKSAAECIPPEMEDIITQTTRPDYSKDIEWEVLAFKKWARPRTKKPE